MSQQRFERRRRAARWRRLRPYVLSFLAAALVGTGIWLVWFSKVLLVEHVDVQGATTMKTSDIRAQADVPLGVPLARLDAQAIETRVARLERVDTVGVSRAWPHTVRVRIVERHPIAWVRADGLIRQVDRYGVDFRTLDREPDNLIEIRIFTMEPRTRQQAMESMARVVDFLRAGGQDVFREVRFVSASSQDSIHLELSGRRTVVWGSAERDAKKLTVLRALLRIHASRYDVSAPELPTTKK